MKKLICAKDVQAIEKRGQKVFHIEEGTVITPLAKDVAKNLGIEFSMEAQTPKAGSCCLPAEASGEEIDSDTIYRIFRIMKEKGLLKEVLSLLVKKPFITEIGAEGLKIVRGNTVEFHTYDTGNSKDKVFYRELVKEEDSSLSVGLLTIDCSNFTQKLVQNVTGYVIEGLLDITIDGKTLTAYSGDVFYVPSGAQITWGSSNKTKFFYVKS